MKAKYHFSVDPSKNIIELRPTKGFIVKTIVATLVSSLGVGAFFVVLGELADERLNRTLNDLDK